MSGPSEHPGAHPDRPAELGQVLEEELKYLRRHRKDHLSEDQARRSLVGLALSGGGIRSATTSLGALQALSRMGMLSLVDYLCTVSGGGYIGACLTSLLSLKEGDLEPSIKREVAAESKKRPLFGTDWDRFPFNPACESVPPGPGSGFGAKQIAHLRTHGNFLIARTGVLARETLRSIGNLSSGVVYHLFLAAVVLFLLSSAYLAAASWLAEGMSPAFQTAPAVGIGEPGAPANLVEGETTTSRTEVVPCPEDPLGCEVVTETRFDDPSVWDRAVSNVALLRAQLSAPTGMGGTGARILAIAFVAGFVLAVIGFLWVGSKARRIREGWTNPGLDPQPGESVAEVYERRLLRQVGWATLLAALGVVVILRVVFSPERAASLVMLLAPFAALAGAWVFSFLAGALLVPRPTRWSHPMRSLWGSYQALAAYAMLAALALGLFPLLVFAVRDQRPEVAIGAVVSLVATRLLTSRGDGESTSRFRIPAGLRKFLLGVALLLLLLLAVLLICVWLVTAEWSAADLAFAAIVAALVFAVLGRWVDHNKLSPHYFYRDRLAETYLATDVAAGGADVAPSGGSPTSGQVMVPYRNSMELRLEQLHGDDGDRDWRNPAPYHLISCAINLAGSRDLTRRDRKSGYFLFSKLYSGSEHTSFRPTHAYRRGKTKLVRAIAISGAAASSAIGRFTFFGQALAMVLFNLRLGYWMENPRTPESVRKSRGVFWPKWLWREVLMRTDAQGDLVNLSDGGHTGDNMGIYPLLQRRCRVIIVVDGECDADMTFGSITEAMRHAYIDMGIDIDIDFTAIRPDPDTGLSRSHCAVGRIRYPDRTDQQSWLIYMKNSLMGDEPEPVLNYKSNNPAFPHEPTADQFFDDAQFESYRSLGVHLAEHTFGQWLRPTGPELEADAAREAIDALFEVHGARSAPTDGPEIHAPSSAGFPEGLVRLTERAWEHLRMHHYPLRTTGTEEYEQLEMRYVELERWLAADDELSGLYQELLDVADRGVDAGSTAGAGSDEVPDWRRVATRAKVRGATVQLAQFMESAYYTLSLSRYGNAPDNRGWMNLFRRWGRSPTFNAGFDAVQSTFTLEFVNFYNHYLRQYEDPIEIVPIPHPWDPAEARTLRRGHKMTTLAGIYQDSGRREAVSPMETEGAESGPAGAPTAGPHGIEDAKGGDYSYEQPASDSEEGGEK